jgi:hypothetical protein
MLKRKGQATGDETQRPNSWEVAWTDEENDVGYSCPLAKWELVDRAEVVHALAARRTNASYGIEVGAADLTEAEAEALSPSLRLEPRPWTGLWLRIPSHGCCAGSYHGLAHGAPRNGCNRNCIELDASIVGNSGTSCL